MARSGILENLLRPDGMIISTWRKLRRDPLGMLGLAIVLGTGCLLPPPSTGWGRTNSAETFTRGCSMAGAWR
jgi:hypothetical protein